MVTRLMSRLRLAFIISPLLLAGCVNHSTNQEHVNSIETMMPSSEVVDFSVAPCEILWALDDEKVLSNSLYWLRAMDCADRMPALQARFQAQQISQHRWDSVFKQSILLTDADPSDGLRKILLGQVESFSEQMPVSIRPLVQLWREHQMLEIQLADEKARNARQQMVSENQIALLDAQQKSLESELASTQQKLKNLTDIERQLSSRKSLQGEVPDIDDTTNGAQKKSSNTANSGNLSSKKADLSAKSAASQAEENQ